MLKGLFFGLVHCSLFCVSLLGAELCLSPIGEESTIERAVWLKNHTILMLTNQYIVYLHAPPFEEKTWCEWLLCADHTQPDPKFYFDLQQWKSASLFRIYSYQWDHRSKTSHPLQRAFEKNPSLFEFPYIIENLETGEMTLCQIWSHGELGAFIISFGEECYEAGYNDGYIHSR